MGKPDAAYLEVLLRKCADAVEMAGEKLSPARVGWGRGEVQIGINRRERREQGTVLGYNPQGVVARFTDVLRVDLEGRRLVWCLHAAHAVVLGGNNLHISADYPNYVRRTVEGGATVPTTSLFAQGACGNINAQVVGGTFEDARRLGTILGAEVVRTAEQVEVKEEMVLAAKSRRLELPVLVPAPEQARATLAEYQRRWEEAKAAGADERCLGMLADQVALEEEFVEIAEGKRPADSAPFEVQVMRIGNGALVGLSGEVFVEHALNIEKVSPAAHTAVAAYTNGVVGYIPTREAYAEGGYEVEVAHHYYGRLAVAPEAGEMIVQAAADLLSEMWA